ncbi:rRNA processing/ribosome biogenesis-domain-containing protein [Trametes punicea]|nr:rRNA processing/ribosome biogenesis-domain-containing protein [Trametes punicea]
MDSSHRLKDFLQFQLASDAYAVSHLPFVLETLSREDFQPSAHSQKWIARVNSLIHSKDPGARWSGLCLAFQSALFSRSIMLECAQSWVAAAMPLLVNQPPPTTKAAIRLLRLVFSSATDVPEFQRQLCVPNVPKFSNALLAIAEKETNDEVRLLVLDTLVHIVSLYPTLCRPLHSALSNVALRHLNGSAPSPTPKSMVEACSRLYSILPLTGGKVGAAGLWRKAVDETVAFIWGAFLQLRTTFLVPAYATTARPAPSAEDPLIGVPLALDRLRAGVRVIGDLLCATISRPVSIPIGSLVRICLALLLCKRDEKSDSPVDPTVRSLENSVIPILWTLACDILMPLSKAAGHHLTPHLPVLLTHLAFHLEQSLPPTQTVSFLQATLYLLESCRLHDSTLSSRLVRVTMPLLTVLLSARSLAAPASEPGSTQGKSNKGKKRARGYEGDEVFKLSREIICQTPDEGDILLMAVDVLVCLLLRTQVNPPVYSLASRLLFSIYASLPQIPPAILSRDLSMHSKLHARIERACVHLAIGTTGTMGKTLGLVLSVSDGTLCNDDGFTMPTEIDLSLHPRVPPLVRSLPHVEMLSLFRAEESQEEIDARTTLGVAAIEEDDPAQSHAAEKIVLPLNGQTEQPRASISPPVEVVNNAGAPPAPGQSSTAVQVDIAPPLASTTYGAIGTESVQLAPRQGSISQAEVRTSQSSQARPTSLPPPPDPLPSSSATLGPRSATTFAPPVSSAIPLPAEDDDEDEPMPAIDLGSDSDSE